MKNSLRKNRSLGLVIVYLSFVVNMLSGLVLSSFLLRSLGDVEYGLYQTVSSFTSYLVLLEFGTGTVMTRNILFCINEVPGDRREETVKRNFSTVWIISLILSCIILLGASVFYFNLGSIYSKTMDNEQIAYAKRILLLLTGNVIATYLNQNTNGFLLAHEEYTFSHILSFIRVIMRTVIIIAVISQFRYAILIAVIDVSLSAMVFVVTLIYSDRKYHVRLSFKCFDLGVFKASIPMCMALLLQTITNQANNNVDMFVIGVMMNLESVALYSVVQYVFSVVATVGTLPLSMFMPEVSKNVSKNLEPRELTETLIKPCRLTVVICGSILFGFFAVGQQFITLVFGAEKTAAWLYALIIIVPMFINMTNAVIINILDITNKRLVRSLVLLGTAVMNILLTILFINFWGIIGAVIATAIALMCNVVILNIYYKRTFGLHILYLFKEAYKGLIPFQLIAGIAAFFAARFIPNPFVSLLAGGVLYLILSFIPIYFFGLRADEKQKINSVLKRVKIKK